MKERPAVAYFLALGAAILYGVSDFAGGLASRKKTTLVVFFFAQAAGLVALATIQALLPAATPTRTDVLWGAAAGLTGGVGVALLYHALAIGAMAVVAPTTAVCAVAIPVVISVLLGERPSPLGIAGIALAIGAIILVSHERGAKGAASSRGIGIALASGVLIGLFFVSLARTERAAALWPLVVARVLSVAVFGALLLARRQPLGMPARVAALTLVCGVLDALANTLYLLATREGRLSVVVTLASLYPAATVLLARLFLRERLNPWQRAGVLGALGAFVLIVRGD